MEIKDKTIFCGGTGNISKDSLDKINEFTGKIEKWRQLRTDAITEMFENVDEYGIYPTGEFFKKIDSAVNSIINNEF